METDEYIVELHSENQDWFLKKTFFASLGG